MERSNAMDDNHESYEINTEADMSITTYDVQPTCNPLTSNSSNIRTRDVDDEEIWNVVTKSGKRLARCVQNERVSEEKVEISVTSKEPLPKQFAFARLLKNNNILNILKIKYINAYKLIIQFEDESMLTKFLECEEIKNKSWNLQRTLEVGISYGIIKNVELELSEPEVFDSITSTAELIAVKRLNRRTDDGTQWTPSETIRLCFKGSSLPAFVYVYGVRTRIETYTFPVTQCSFCWRYGHPRKVCPKKKQVCVKCTKDHGNCEIVEDQFVCVNCRGNHMSLSSNCPVKIKERKIREIMADFNCTYKRALTMYVPPDTSVVDENQPINESETYEEVHNIDNTPLKTSISYASVTASKSTQNQKQKLANKQRLHKTKTNNNKKTRQTDDINWDEIMNMDIPEETDTESTEERRSESTNKKTALNIIQWNCQSLTSKGLTLEQLLTIEKIHIAALNETWLDARTDFRINGYNIFRKDRNDGYGVVAVMTHHSIQAKIQNTSSRNPGIELIHVKIFNSEYLQNIISVYCPPSVTTSQQDWDELFSLFSEKTLILGDMNGHHSSWSYKTDTRGVQIFDALLNYNFIILNDGSPTRIKLVNGTLHQSSPDISIVSSDVAIEYDWNVLNETLGSDHLMIKIATNNNTQYSYIKKRNLKKADWNLYQKILKHSFAHLMIPEELQEAYNLFIDEINKAAGKSIPYVKISQDPCSKFTPRPYWNTKLSKAIAERRLALRNFRRNSTPANLSILKGKISEAQRISREAKSKGWMTFCSSLNEVSTAGEMWQRMKWIKGRKTQKLNIEENLAFSLLRSLSPDYVVSKEPDFNSCNFKLELPVSLHEMEQCIKRSDTTPGCDNISFSMIKNLPKCAKIYLVSLYSSFLKYAFVPVQWRDVRICPIPKPGRVPNTCTSLRPIALMSCLCKIFHSIIKSRLEWYLERNDMLAQNTIGFRKCRSCLDGLSHLVTKIQTGFSKGFVTLGCFIDINNAYNNVDINVLLSKLDEVGVGSGICNYLWNFLKQRRLKIHVDSSIKCRYTGQGLAQGDPLSPLLFNVATMSICKNLNDSIFISQYADDLAMSVTCKDINSAVSELQPALDRVTRLLGDLGLEISAVKSKTCLFNRSRKQPPSNLCTLKINNRWLELADSVKYLGLWLDRSLRWGKHVNETNDKVIKFLKILKLLAGPGWGVHPKHLRRLYLSIIRSRIDYGSFLYDNSCKSHLYKLDKIQNQSMRLIGGFIKTTPIHVMESELALQPLFVRRRYLAGKFILKIKSLKINGIISFLEEFGISHNNSNFWTHKKKPLLYTLYAELQDVPLHTTTKLEMFSFNIWINNINITNNIKFIDTITKAKKDYSRLDLQTISSEMMTKYVHYYKIYTDGSKDFEPAGAAFFDEQIGTGCKFKISANVSIMYLELFAILEALSYVATIDENNIVIFTDSKSSLQHLARCTSTFRGTPIAYEILKLLQHYNYICKNVRLQWIPSHVGITGNEKADQLAKEAITDGIDISVKPFYADCIYLIRKICFELWTEYFDERSKEKGIWYKTIQPQPPGISWIDNLSMKRTDVTLMMRLRSGHIPLNRFAHLIKKVNSPNCSTCNTTEDVLHILAECARNESYRRQHFKDCSSNIGYFNSVLANPYSVEARRILRLVEIGIGNR
ncbi:unnamed protein product [Euphydryas editha]|uniref:Uncharacterized protein n=1 Tax=Euphydryas editha TaxID=104508 RepID=A0AAU9U4W9_EUPED|nr:unnamed protein product [Euphydryas editha]